MVAIGLTKVQQTAPALVDLCKSAGASLVKHGLGGQRAAVCLVVDHSGSMKPYYRDGSVRALADRVLGLSAHLDDDGRVPVVFFSTDVDVDVEAVTDIAIGFGDRGGKQFDCLRKLDELPVPAKRAVGNAGFFRAGQDPRTVQDAELYDRPASEFPRWPTAARARGIVTA